MQIFRLASVIAGLLLAPSPTAGDTNDPMKLLRSFNSSPENPPWFAQNDPVMGGHSNGQAEITGGTLRFFGKLSLENNGGFAQIYSPVEERDFSAYSGIILQVKGDGRSYQFRLATKARFRGSPVAYRAEFPTEANQWTEVTLPFSDFIPGYRGRTLSGPRLNPSSIERMGFLLADGQEGNFLLQVEWIGME